MNIIPKVKDFTENGVSKISPEFTSDEKLGFCKKAFHRMVFKLYDIRLTEGEGGIKLLYDEKLEKDEYRIVLRQLPGSEGTSHFNRVYHYVLVCCLDA